MKKLMLTALTVLSCGAAFALPVGNASEASLYTNGLCWGGSSCCDPCDPCWSWCDMFSVRVGFYGDYVFNRHLEATSSARDHADIKDTELYTNAGYLALNVCDWLDVFATFGATNLSILSDAKAFIQDDTTMVQLNYDPTFSWSIGGRATAWQSGCFTVGVEGQYFRTSPNLDNMIRYASGDVIYFNSNNSATYQEWQAGIVASYNFMTGCPGVAMVPYMGLKWANGKLDTGDLTFIPTGTALTYTIGEMIPKKVWGYAIGLTTTVCDVVGLTVEARFADEKALYVNGQFRF
ncbi:MAG: Major outer membrane porin [Chlamydiales bacterium]|nr:Major outer membrane porin [Chlamydiales bacterium]MCH9620298.1 Major outer membrane porin [Chlamydiales bacterium]MCH9622791.1 Major outer membrane porin [Chlamydiales bacterium]